MHKFSCTRNAVCIHVTYTFVTVHTICEGLCVDIILINSKFSIIPSCFDVNKLLFFVNDSSSITVLYGNNDTYLTLQNKFLEDLRY